MSTEEFCGGYKGDHVFEDESNQCRCGRAFRRAPRPAPVPVEAGLPSLAEERFFDAAVDLILAGATRKPREAPAPRPEPRQEPLEDPTLAQVWEQGHEAGLNDMSTCCGCSTPMEETPNPYA